MIHVGVIELTPGLDEVVLRYRQQHPGSRLRAQRGGWASAKFLHDWPEFEAIVKTLETSWLNGLSVREMWATVMEYGNQVGSHNHSGVGQTNEASGVLYLRAKGPGGELVLGEQNVRLTPWPGLCVLFPAGMFHRVEEYRGQTPRVAIAFNA